MAILLVRHGETPANAARVVQLPDAPLSERGLAQAALLAARLAKQGVARIVASDYARARGTAEQVQVATNAPLELWPELRERNFGELRGRSYAEIGADIFAPDFAPPGGETWAEFHARVERAWERLRVCAGQVEGDLAVISHGLVCRSVVERLVPRPDGVEVPLVWGNTSLTVISPFPPNEIALLNCSAHLLALAPSPVARAGAV